MFKLCNWDVRSELTGFRAAERVPSPIELGSFLLQTISRQICASLGFLPSCTFALLSRRSSASAASFYGSVCLTPECAKAFIANIREGGGREGVFTRRPTASYEFWASDLSVVRGKSWNMWTRYIKYIRFVGGLRSADPWARLPQMLEPTGLRCEEVAVGPSQWSSPHPREPGTSRSITVSLSEGQQRAALRERWRRGG